MSLTPFQLISVEEKKKLLFTYFPFLQMSLSNLLHFCRPFAFSDSRNPLRPVNPPLITLCL